MEIIIRKLQIRISSLLEVIFSPSLEPNLPKSQESKEGDIFFLEMETTHSNQNIKLKIVVTVACLAAISLYFTAKRWKRQSRRKLSCYLEAERKPQYAFRRVLADNSYSSFNHLNLGDARDNGDSVHPYEKEIKALLENPQIDFTPFRGNVKAEMKERYVWVETESQLQELVHVLSKEKVFGVDTEQHNLRSYRGFTALVQISTRTEDYLLDTIALHDSMSILRPVFADSSICKVFHGADNDVLWLQKDFHIYVVNLFDTAKACEVLSKPQKSLAYLLETYCGVSTNKLLQREDWRQRPLPDEMIEYARMDAHYLLYIASCLIDELRDSDTASQDDNFRFLVEASRRSNTTCLQLYLKEVEDFPGESAASSILYRHFPNQEQASTSTLTFQDLVRKLCAWRDLMARIHDESLRYVLSDQAIIALANHLPTKEEDIFDLICQTEGDTEVSASVSPLPSPSPIFCCHSDDLLLLNESTSNDDNILKTILLRHLGANGSCPLSVQNYALLSKFDLKYKSRTEPKQNGARHAKHMGKKASRELFVRKFSCKAPVYHNCRIYATDGRLLCYCDRRKLEWYLQRNLAKLVEDDPPAIMLLFEPKGRPEDEGNDFYIQSKKNMCVGCGEKNHYLRYRIIPSCYRMHFPEHLKSHRSHDIVLLCVDCHEIAHAAAEMYKRRIANEFEIPLFVKRVADPKQAQLASESEGSVAVEEEGGVSPLHLRMAATALLRHGPAMPTKRRGELIEVVKRYYGGREITQDDLENALAVGMSPHERRKFEKKRGTTVKQAASGIILNNELGKDPEIMTRPTSDNNIDSDHLNGSCDVQEQALNEIECSGPDERIDDSEEKSRPSEMLEEGMSEDSSPTNNEIACSTDKVDECINTANGSGAVSKGYGSKVSLLGHGPHGKQVVDHVLKEYGEDGIGQFCQRWRQVFVDAVHPRYLPGGWDVMHSGRREFGEYSVYHPMKKVSTSSDG